MGIRFLGGGLLINLRDLRDFGRFWTDELILFFLLLSACVFLSD
jgi:hypothetical protein